MPIGQESGAHSIWSLSSMLARISIGAIPSRSSLLMKVMMGVLRIRQTSMSFSVWGSTPLPLSMTMSALSTAVRTR